MRLFNWFSSTVRAALDRRRRVFLRFLPVLLFCFAFGCSLSASERRSPPIAIDSPPLPAVARTNESVKPLPLKIEGLNPDKVALGRQLFADTRLSGDDTIACASCHNLQLGGTDRRQVSIGIGGAKGKLNSPTVFNSIYNFRQFWDGRAASLEEQIDGPIHSPDEMGSSWPEVIDKLQRDANYRRQFQQIYGSERRKRSGTSAPVAEIAPETIRDAIATYERSLISPNAPFDRYLKGDLQALTSKERGGYRRFRAYGCISCHQGIAIGGNMFQHFGIFGNYFEDSQDLQPEDLGRYNVTGAASDRYVFKVPSLRNVELTPPYFHDGSVETLAEAVRIMGQYQLGRILTDEDVDALVQFLRSLTGENPAAIEEGNRKGEEDRKGEGKREP